MHIIGLLITLAIVGLIAGALARLLVPGHDALGIGGTMGLGIVGSFVGGFLGYLLFGHDSGDGFIQPSGIIGSVIGSVIALLVYRRMGSRRSLHI
ncbi:GlsB/YeaQ/YmgE family stress response membrane protein [Jatrophihabitans sp.]|uniref:GlsB/YeaQ/YmgE family stress response membrane protein n=1 Tax=Jatrophihabitans sp. TaxID=1932789 RepID=UPI0030C6745E|nr:transglycosylase [Jatrophihabitans sp.]